jgi:hypothetical protein
LNTYTTSIQAFASVAPDGAGNFVAAWTSYGQDESSYGAFARRFQTDLIFEDGFEASGRSLP